VDEKQLHESEHAIEEAKEAATHVPHLEHDQDVETWLEEPDADQAPRPD
jgi:hypothetical protein